MVPNFIVQGGDPTETGEGGESVYGAPFKVSLKKKKFSLKHQNGEQYCVVS